MEYLFSLNEHITILYNLLFYVHSFPIPDLRPLSDINRLPWWKRILRDDILWLYLSDVECSFTKTSQQTITTGYEIQCRTIEALFQEGNNNSIIPIAKCQGIDDDFKIMRMDGNHRLK